MKRLNKVVIMSGMKLKAFLNDEEGDIVQTAVIIGILAIVAITVLTTLKTPISNVFIKIKEGIESAL